MTEEKREYQINILRSQKGNDHANYRKYMVNLYRYYERKIAESHTDWCISSLSEMYKIITDGCHNPDCSFSSMKRYVKEIHDLGYIKDVYEDGEWHSYIIKELDF